MIFVALGTQKFQMNRLIEQMDKLIDKGMLKEEVFAQIGNSDYIPEHYSFVTFLEKDDFEKKIKECSVLITHGGASTIISGLKYAKPTIVVPRLKKFGEHVDDHQSQLARAFEKSNYVLVCYEIDQLENLIKKSRTHIFSAYHSDRDRMICIINDYLDSLMS